MKQVRKLTFVLPALLLLWASVLPVAAQPPKPSPSAPLFQDRPFGPRPAPTLPRAVKPKESQPEKPIPIVWVISGGLAAVASAVALLYWAARAWRSSNLFDRQHRFPEAKEAALRLGGTRRGGHMARLRFGTSASSRPGRQRLKTEDA